MDIVDYTHIIVNSLHIKHKHLTLC